MTVLKRLLNQSTFVCFSALASACNSAQSPSADGPTGVGGGGGTAATAGGGETSASGGEASGGNGTGGTTSNGGAAGGRQNGQSGGSGGQASSNTGGQGADNANGGAGHTGGGGQVECDSTTEAITFLIGNQVVTNEGCQYVNKPADGTAGCGCLEGQICYILQEPTATGLPPNPMVGDRLCSDLPESCGAEPTCECFDPCSRHIGYEPCSVVGTTPGLFIFSCAPESGG